MVLAKKTCIASIRMLSSTVIAWWPQSSATVCTSSSTCWSTIEMMSIISPITSSIKHNHYHGYELRVSDPSSLLLHHIADLVCHLVGLLVQHHDMTTDFGSFSKDSQHTSWQIFDTGHRSPIWHQSQMNMNWDQNLLKLSRKAASSPACSRLASMPSAAHSTPPTLQLQTAN